ncbi:hypothetical protein LUZ60_010762 [Juncus effusus]|nr:hypothetical protein LUZ60_010762 [Juncus effusus]
MEMHPIFHFAHPWRFFFFPPFQSSPFPPPNYVHWTETASSHLYTVSLPGIKKQEIRVEVENSIYLSIYTNLEEEEQTERYTKHRNFNKKFRLPLRVNLDGITARYENGMLSVDVPRLVSRERLGIEFPDLDRVDNPVARAA